MNNLIRDYTSRSLVPARTVGDDAAVLGREQSGRAGPDQLKPGRLLVRQLPVGAATL